MGCDQCPVYVDTRNSPIMGCTQRPVYVKNIGILLQWVVLNVQNI